MSNTAREAIEDANAEVWVSAASAMEIATKYRIGKLPQARALALDLQDMVDGQGFAHLPISLVHARAAGLSPIPHKDPFDRLLIAQAHIERMTLISNETMFDGFGVARLW